MTTAGDARSRKAAYWGGAGLLLLSTACGARSALEVGASRGVEPTPAGTAGASAGTTESSGGVPLAGRGGSGPTGSGGGGVPSAAPGPPNARRTPPRMCTADGWCGSLGDYVAIWGSSVFDIWIAANDIQAEPSPASDALRTSALVHWNGVQWNVADLPEPLTSKLTSIWGSSSTDVWVVGSPAYAAHFDGTSWARSFLPTSTPTQIDVVWGTGSADVWAAGYGLFHFDGAAWQPIVTADLRSPITSGWATTGDVWLVSDGLPRRSQDFAQSWTPAAPSLDPSQPPPRYIWTSVWGSRAGAPLAAGRAGALGRWSDGSWLVEPVVGTDALNFNAVGGISSEDAWAVGDNGVLAHWDGASWSHHHSPTQQVLHGIWGSDGHTFAVGDHGTFLELDEGEWTSNQASAAEIEGIWGGVPADVWAVGKDSVHWDGTTWAQVDGLADMNLNGVWGSAPDDVWVAGQQGVLAHFDGNEWTRATSPTTEEIKGIWGSGPRDIWAVDRGGTFLRFDGRIWARWPTADFGPMSAVYGSRADNVVAVGERARVRFDGRAWTRLPSHPTESPQYLSAFGDGTSVFMGGMVAWSGYKAGGANPELGRWDGSSVFDNLEPILSGNAAVTCGWASKPADVWIAVPALHHWDGAAWTKARIGKTSAPVSALGATPEDLWAGDAVGQLLRRRRR